MPVVPQSRDEFAQARNLMQSDLEALQKSGLQLQDPLREVMDLTPDLAAALEKLQKRFSAKKTRKS